MKLWLTIRQIAHPDTGNLVWEWFFEDSNGFVAGGYASTEAGANYDAALWRHHHDYP